MCVFAVLLTVELRLDSSSVIRCATSVCPDLAVQLITQLIDKQMDQPPQPQQPSTTVSVFLISTAAVSAQYGGSCALLNCIDLDK